MKAAPAIPAAPRPAAPRPAALHSAAQFGVPRLSVPRFPASVLPAVRACYGGALLCAPGLMIRIAAGHPASSRARSVARLLGARHLLQAALTARPAPGAVRQRVGAAVDLTHAASMTGLAAADRGLRRAALTDALIEATFAAAASRRAALRASGAAWR